MNDPLEHLSTDERRVAHSALLAQVDDNHAGGVMGWTDPDYRTAEALFERLDAEARADVPTIALLLSLLYPVHDTDHPLMTDAEADAAEIMLVELSQEFGR